MTTNFVQKPLCVSACFWPTLRMLPLDLTPDMTDYEVLMQVCTKLNELIKASALSEPVLEALKQDVENLQAQIDAITNGDYAFLKEIIEKAIKMVFFGLTPQGQFVAYIPESWEDIMFRTSGYDVIVPDVGFGHLVLLY